MQTDRDPWATYARTGESRNGSGFERGQSFKRRESVWVWAFKLARDFLAVVAALVVAWAVLGGFYHG